MEGTIEAMSSKCATKHCNNPVTRTIWCDRCMDAWMSFSDQQEAEEWAYKAFAKAHPHEAYEMDPERFWKFFHTERPGMTRQQMIDCLEETR